MAKLDHLNQMNDKLNLIKIDDQTHFQHVMIINQAKQNNTQKYTTIKKQSRVSS